MKGDLHPESHHSNPLDARLMVFPRYSADQPQRLSPRSKAQSFILAAYHSFNYSIMGKAGFDAMAALMTEVDCYDLVYHDLDWAIETLRDLHSKAAPP